MVDIKRLAEIREDQDITQEEMAKILGVNRSAYSLWELGINIIPLKHLYNYANYFNLSIDYVLGLNNNRTKVIYQEFNLQNIGGILKKLRKDNHLSQQQLAKKINVSQVCIGKYELGYICISTSNIIKYSQYFHISITELCNQKRDS